MIQDPSKCIVPLRGIYTGAAERDYKSFAERA